MCHRPSLILLTLAVLGRMLVLKESATQASTLKLSWYTCHLELESFFFIILFAPRLQQAFSILVYLGYKGRLMVISDKFYLSTRYIWKTGLAFLNECRILMRIFDHFYNIIKQLGRIEWNIHEQSFLGLLMIALAHQKLKLTNPVKFFVWGKKMTIRLHDKKMILSRKF